MRRRWQSGSLLAHAGNNAQIHGTLVQANTRNLPIFAEPTLEHDLDLVEWNSSLSLDTVVRRRQCE